MKTSNPSEIEKRFRLYYNRKRPTRRPKARMRTLCKQYDYVHWKLNHLGYGRRRLVKNCFMKGWYVENEY